MEQEPKTHNDIYQAIGHLTGKVEVIQSEVHQIRRVQSDWTGQQAKYIADIREENVNLGRRIAVLEKGKNWVAGVAVGILFMFTVLAADVPSTIKHWLGINTEGRVTK